VVRFLVGDIMYFKRPDHLRTDLLSFPVDTGGFLSPPDGRWKPTTHLHLVPRLRMLVAVPLVPPPPPHALVSGSKLGRRTILPNVCLRQPPYVSVLRLGMWCALGPMLRSRGHILTAKMRLSLHGQLICANLSDA
jgi:hypothetical protein